MAFRGGCVRTIAGEDSCIMDPDFVTSFFHSFALEERLSSSISKEQLALLSVSSDVSLCACGVGRSFTCVWQRSSLPDWARSGQMRVSCMLGLHARVGPRPVPGPASSFLWSCWPGHLSTKAARPHTVPILTKALLSRWHYAWWASI